MKFEISRFQLWVCGVSCGIGEYLYLLRSSRAARKWTPAGLFASFGKSIKVPRPASPKNLFFLHRVHRHARQVCVLLSHTGVNPLPVLGTNWPVSATI